MDTLAATSSVVLYIEGCKILNFSEFILTDHRSIIANINLNEYFDTATSAFDKKIFLVV